MAIELKGFKGLMDVDNLLEESKQMPRVSALGVVYLPHGMLVAGKYQPRHTFNDEALTELVSSIVANGIIQPIIVRKKEQENKYEIIAGERRWRAAQKAGLKEVPVVVREITDETALAFGLIENIQREDLNPIEEATALDRLHREFKMSPQEIAERVGRSRPAVWSLMKLLSLPAEVKALIENKKIDVGHAKALFSLEEERLVFYARQIVENGLSVRQAEELVQKIKSGQVKDTNKNHITYGEEIALCNRSLSDWNKMLSDKFFSSVHIKLNRKGEGKVTFQVDSVKDLEWLINKLHPENEKDVQAGDRQKR